MSPLEPTKRTSTPANRSLQYKKCRYGTARGDRVIASPSGKMVSVLAGVGNGLGTLLFESSFPSSPATLRIPPAVETPPGAACDPNSFVGEDDDDDVVVVVVVVDDGDVIVPAESGVDSGLDANGSSENAAVCGG
eukprot:TRINITY_DN4020_c0_g1_i1.p2 TRINITY_DN4020_c0_g1~~TRINITY_DN4020_c0_g1_i1.p2  ORF type:complete len:153 (+),score=11.40 TRINITY_DN4020_c0_g1_i1:57-461(+)